ncbi:MAG: hypothetical protein AAB473_00690 [Patescibacteria group bacterium]
MRLLVFLVVCFLEAAEAVVGLAACVAFFPFYLYLVWTGSALDEGSPLPVLE